MAYAQRQAFAAQSSARDTRIETWGVLSVGEREDYWVSGHLLEKQAATAGVLA
jgi:hypothetical protein